MLHKVVRSGFQLIWIELVRTEVKCLWRTLREDKHTTEEGDSLPNLHRQRLRQPKAANQLKTENDGQILRQWIK